MTGTGSARYRLLAPSGIGKSRYQRRRGYYTHCNQSINQSIKVICNARNVVHKLESEARAVASGRVLMVIEKVGLEASFESI